MMTFRKLSASSSGKLLRAYFTENTPDARHDFRTDQGKVLDSGGRLTSYYTGRDSRATWGSDLSYEMATALGIDRLAMPKNDDLDRLFEAKRADTGEAWSKHKREISAYDLTLTPHKSVSLAIEFASSAAESAMIWHAIDRASDATIRYAGRELGWARKGKGGEEGAEPGEVAWVSFRHHTARPTLAVQDGPDGATYLAESPTVGDPLAHIHHALLNMVLTKDGRIGSLDTQRLHSRVHEFGGYFQAKLADELRALGIRTGYDAKEQAVVLEAIPQTAVDTFSKRSRDVQRSAKEYAEAQGLDWEQLSVEAKMGILSMGGLAFRMKKHGDKNEHAIWSEQAEAIGWKHDTVLEGAKPLSLTDKERFDLAYAFAARHLEQEFHTSAVIDHDKLRTHAVRGLIGTGIAGGTADIDQVVKLIEQRGIELRGERVALVIGLSGDRVRVTNTAQVRIEQSMATLASQAAGDRKGALSTAGIKAAIDASGLDFTSDPEHGRAQQAAIYTLGRGSALTLLTGVAGSGKTTLLQPLVAAWKADARFEAGGRHVVGIATGWRQADALKDAGVDDTLAIAPLLKSIEEGSFKASRNTVIVIDEISQVAPRSMLALLELQRRTGLTIKALGDREQAQSVEAGDAVEILRRALPREEQAELLSTVRQTRRRDREVASMFRGTEPDLDQLPDLPTRQRGRKVDGRRVAVADAESQADALQEFHLGEVKRALSMKREDRTAQLVGGDHDQVLGRIADFYMERRDALHAVRSKRGITVSTLTNQDAAYVSRTIRGRLQQRGELGADEQIVPAIDQRGEQYQLPIATGDRIRLFKRTWAQVDGKGAAIGNNGDIVEVAGKWAGGLMLRDGDGRVGQVAWERLEDRKTGRLLIGFGHAMTVDAAQGITSDEHINALPRGSGGMTGFTAYVAESRARGATWTLISDEATFEAVRNKRALGDQTPVTAQDMWDKVAGDMAGKPYKALGMDLLQATRDDREKAVRAFMQDALRVDRLEARGVDVGLEIRARVQAEAVRGAIPALLSSLDAAIADAETTFEGPMSKAEAHLRTLRVDAELSRRAIEEAASRPRGQAASPS